MNPEQQSPLQQQPAVSSEQPAPRSHRKLLGILLIVGPTALIVGSILLYAVINFIISAASSPDSSGLIGNQPMIVTILNVVLFLFGAVSVFAWLPCLIIGIVLLATQKK